MADSETDYPKWVVNMLRAHKMHEPECRTVTERCLQPGCLVAHPPPKCTCWLAESLRER